jgi:hypothetical protein
MKLLTTGFVVANKRDWSSDHRCNRALVFIGESQQKSRWECYKGDSLAQVRFLRSTVIIAASECSAWTGGYPIVLPET